MNIHSLTFDIHFCFAIDLSLKKNPNEIFVEILFNLKIIAIQNWNQSYTYILFYSQHSNNGTSTSSTI